MKHTCTWWWLTGICDPIECSIVGGGMPTHNSGYKSTRLWTLFYLGYFFSHPQKMALVPPLPPPRFTRVPCPPRHISCAYYLYPPISSFPFNFRLVDSPPPAAPVVTCRPPVVSLQPSDWLPADAMLPLVSCQESWRMKVFPPTYAAGSTWFGFGWKGVGAGAPLNDLEVLNVLTGTASPKNNNNKTILDPHSWSWCPSLSAPPSPFPRTTVLVSIPSLIMEECFRGRPIRPQPTSPPGLALPVVLLNASRSPFCFISPPPPYSMAMLWVGVR